jgi:hypothetical protein
LQRLQEEVNGGQFSFPDMPNGFFRKVQSNVRATKNIMSPLQWWFSGGPYPLTDSFQSYSLPLFRRTIAFEAPMNLQQETTTQEVLAGLVERVTFHNVDNGQQFKARFMRTSEPTSIDGIEKYLGSGMIRGIGPVYAKKMVKAFGEKVFDIIEAEPDRLREVTGIGAVRAKRITEAWADQKIVREIMVFLGFVTLLNEEREKLRVISPQATAARQVSIAAARKPRCVDAEVR